MHRSNTTISEDCPETSENSQKILLHCLTTTFEQPFERHTFDFTRRPQVKIP